MGSTPRHEGGLVDKLRLYEEAGVRECGILHPEDGWMATQVLGPDGRFRRGPFLTRRDTVRMEVFLELPPTPAEARGRQRGKAPRRRKVSP